MLYDTKQREFSFTAQGAQDQYLEHQRKLMLEFYKSRNLTKKDRINWVTEGHADKFYEQWYTHYYGDVVEDQTIDAKNRWETNDITRLL